MVVFPVLLSLAAFGSTYLGGLVAVRFQNRQGILSAFAAGVLIAVPLFDLLPEAIGIAAKVGLSVEKVLYLTACGFLFLYIMDRYISVHRVCQNGDCQNLRHPRGGLFSALELSIHSFMDGFAIGTGFRFDPHVGLLVAIAVLAHDFSDGLNTVTVMLNSGNSLRSALSMLFFDALAPVLGTVSSLFLFLPEPSLVLILAFFAGGFFYIGAGDLLPEAHEKNPPLHSLIATLAGFTVIFVISKVLGG